MGRARRKHHPARNLPDVRAFVILAEKASPFVKKGKPQPGDPGYLPSKTEGEDWQGQEEWQGVLSDPADPTADDGLKETGGTPMPDGATPPVEGDPAAQDPELVDPAVDPAAAADPAMDPSATDPAADPTAEPADPMSHPWAGDPVDDESTITDPEASFRSFTGPNGEAAWLDRTDDGSLVGWVRDSDGQTYRYTDPDAWAVDVDDAAMTEAGGTNPSTGDPAAPPADPAAADQTPGVTDAVEMPPVSPTDPAMQQKHLRLVRRVSIPS